MTFRFRYAGKVDHEEDLLVDGAYSFLISPIFGDVPDVKVDHRKLRTRRIGIVGKFAGASVELSAFASPRLENLLLSIFRRHLEDRSMLGNDRTLIDIDSIQAHDCTCSLISPSNSWYTMSTRPLAP